MAGAARVKVAETDCVPVSDGVGDAVADGVPVVDAVPDGDAENDGDALCAALVAAKSDVVGTLSGLQGPWAFVLWDGDTLWFGRDVFGRRRHAIVVIASLSLLVTPISRPSTASSYAGRQRQMRACCLHRQRPWTLMPWQAGMSCRRACPRCLWGPHSR